MLRHKNILFVLLILILGAQLRAGVDADPRHAATPAFILDHSRSKWAVSESISLPKVVGTIAGTKCGYGPALWSSTALLGSLVGQEICSVPTRSFAVGRKDYLFRCSGLSPPVSSEYAP